MFMGPSGDHRAHAISRHLKVLLPPPFSSLHKLRISDELARQLVSDTGAGGTALVVSPFDSKVWRVEVGRDGGGAFLGRGWPEFVAAHGIDALWFLVFRHEGVGTLTVKAFDTSFFLHEFSRPINANRSTTSGMSGRPQFIIVLLRGIMTKMVIPSRFVRNHLTEAETSSRLTVLRMCGKDWRVKVEKDRPGNVFLSGGWSRFLSSNGINEGEVLLLRYEGNLVFTVKAFGLDGNQKSDQMKMKKGEDAHSSSTAVKRKSKNEGPSIAGKKRPTGSATPSSKGGSEGARTQSTYDIAPPSWIKKEISAYALQHHLSLSSTFCKTIGFLETCEITLRTSTGNGATRSWQVNVGVRRCSSHYWLGKGWKSFCEDNGLKEGDICTFNIIKTTLWHVDIVRRP